MLPFTREQFVAVFAAYNVSVWPAQVVAYGLGLAVLFALWRGPSTSATRLVGASLGALWVWTGVAYHALHFAAINRAAWAFGAFFVAQGAAWFYVGTQARLTFARGRGAAAWIGFALMVYAMVIYPLLGLAAGHRLVELPMFGITPCPLTIFTLGVLLWMMSMPPWWLLAVPLAWSLVGGSAAFLLRVPQDWPLLFSGVVVAALLARGRPRPDAPSLPRRAAG